MVAESGISIGSVVSVEVAPNLGPVSIVIPTYKEAGNIPMLLGRLDAVRRAHNLQIEVLIMDDDSRDGIDLAVEQAGYSWVRLVVRKTDRGLSPAVLDGLRLARFPTVVVMDADLSHPPERIAALLDELSMGRQLVIGSRNVAGASVDGDWGLFRWLNSRVATWMARPFTKARDPMSGFFAMRRADLQTAAPINPVGYKIALELIVKCGLTDIGEVPIHFADRTIGDSKLSIKEQLKYLQHLRRLFVYKFSFLSQALQFAAVGVSGLAVNLLVLTLAMRLSATHAKAVAAGIAVSIVTNFLLNRRFTFTAGGRAGSAIRQFALFVVTSMIGALVNFAVTLRVARAAPTRPLQLAACAGVLAGMSFNFLANRYIVFRANKNAEQRNRGLANFSPFGVGPVA